MRLEVIAMLSWAWIDVSRGYQTKAWDCSNPQQIRSYSTVSACNNIQQEAEKQEWNLYTKATIQDTPGVRCELHVNRWSFLCGVWGHLKLYSTPHILHPVNIPMTECWSAFRGKTYRYEGILHPIQLNKLNIFSTNPIGTITHHDGSIQCAGQQTKEDGEVVNDLLILEELRLLVKPEKFVRQGDKMQAGSDHLNLPCGYQEGGCITGEGTFVWPPNEEKCDLALVKSGTAELTADQLLVSADMKIVTKLGDPDFHPECRIKRLYRTNHPGLFASLSKDAEEVAEFRPQDFDSGLQAETAAEYGLYQLSREQKQKDKGVLEPMCHRLQHQSASRIVPLTGNRFAVAAGQVIHTFTCKEKTVEIREAAKCYQDIPLNTPPSSFMDPTSLIIKKHSAETTCSSRFPAMIYTDQGWIKLTPAIHPAGPPLEQWTDATGPEFIDLEGAGAFTNREKLEWLALLNFPDFHAATLTMVTRQTCPGMSSCPRAIKENQRDALDWSSIRQAVGEMSPVAKIDKWIREESSYISLLAIVIICAKFLVQVITIIVISAIEGIQGVKRAVRAMCCNIWVQRRRPKPPTIQVKMKELIKHKEEMLQILNQP